MVSIIVPWFNQAGVLSAQTDKLLQIINGLNQPVEFVFIDDGSSDDTMILLKKIFTAEKLPYTLIRLTKNYGQHNATLCGIAHAKGDILLTMDADKLLAGAIKQVLAYIQNQPTHPEVLYGINTNKEQALHRLLIGELFALSFRIFFSKAKHVSSTRIISKDLAARMLNEQNNFIIIDAIFDREARSAGSFKYQADDSYSTSAYKLSGLFRLAIGLYIFYKPVIPIFSFITLTAITSLLIYSGNMGVGIAVGTLTIMYFFIVYFYYKQIQNRYPEKYKIAELICK